MRNISTVIRRVRCDLPITEEESIFLTKYLESIDRRRNVIINAIGFFSVCALLTLLFIQFGH